ncbi:MULTISPECIES: L-aspartate oxidase [Arthrobacter]|uniref:L-aspartate oxidase n=1 Tax=Arthrobacter terricola TaxID=2547396 RepID=A0A4R5KJM1_9MICC|nr:MULTISPECIES: L-aspartate oxidase [Arthrobacter]MBT8161547.1 L-aspartate oxidase [Arthrobacter sp. GN70]TDF95711.1 L-aspartate oxidase [Arthrobacter terricola]
MTAERFPGASARRRLVVVGSGIAGLYSALLAAEAGQDVILLSKGALADSNTFLAQGGISAVLDAPAPGDTVAAHIADTLKAGGGHCNPEAVRVLCSEARQDILGLERFGVRFDVGPDGGPALGLEAAHSAPRILHAGGDATGAGIAKALILAALDAQEAGKLKVVGHAQVTSLIQSEGRVTGVEFLRGGRMESIDADAVLLATGGAGRLFSQTTNPSVATADGLALAWRAGAELADLEFFQFHPTSMVLAAAGDTEPEPLLVSEAVRGEGAILVDATGERFMPAYHPDAELAPRDVVSRSIALHLASLGDPSGHVFLDARVVETAKGPGYLEKRFPTISARTREAGIDWTREPVPVAPAAHYWMGGVVTDLHGRTSVPGLLAAGEVACTGVQGANRLASNSLLEGLVFGRRAVERFLGTPPNGGRTDSLVPSAPALRSHAGERLASPAASMDLHATTALSGASEPAEALTAWQPELVPEPFSRAALRRLMTANAGVLRSGELLREAAGALGAWADVVRPESVSASLDPHRHEDANLLLAAQLLVQAAQARRGSLGAHHRNDAGQEPGTTTESTQQRYTIRRKASLVND